MDRALARALSHLRKVAGAALTPRAPKLRLAIVLGLAAFTLWAVYVVVNLLVRG
jgi:hypothetical protein